MEEVLGRLALNRSALFDLVEVSFPPDSIVRFYLETHRNRSRLDLLCLTIVEFSMTNEPLNRINEFPLRFIKGCPSNPLELEAILRG